MSVLSLHLLPDVDFEFPSLRPQSALTVFDEVLDDVLVSSLHCVMQQRAAIRVLQQEVRSLLVELLQLQNNAKGR